MSFKSKSFKFLSKVVLRKSLAFFVVFILLTVSVFSPHGSALPDDFSISDRKENENVGGDIKHKEENNNSGFVLEHYENGNSTINSMVDVKDVNDDYADFDYTFEFVNRTGPDGSGDFDADGLSNLYEYGYGMGSGYSGLNANSWDSNENMPLPFQSSICPS